MIIVPWLRFAGKPSMTKPFAFSHFFISSPKSRTTSSWAKCPNINYRAITTVTVQASKMLIHDSLPFPSYHDVTDICHEGPFLHGLKDLNILQIRPSEHFPPEEVAGGEVLVTKLARDQLALGSLPCSRASWWDLISTMPRSIVAK